jgi:hypothetical protein
MNFYLEFEDKDSLNHHYEFVLPKLKVRHVPAVYSVVRRMRLIKNQYDLQRRKELENYKLAKKFEDEVVSQSTLTILGDDLLLPITLANIIIHYRISFSLQSALRLINLYFEDQ